MRYIIIAFLMNAFLTFGQSIKGVVIGSDGIPAEYASVRLIYKSDSSVISGAYTDSLGVFALKDIIVNNDRAIVYLLRISYANHEDHFKTYSFSQTKIDNIGSIQLELDKTIDLDEVTANGSLDVLKAGIDKKIYNVQDDISTRGGTVSDVLNNIPSIEVDQDGNISLRGDGNVTILIDGRPSTLVGNDGQNLLDAFPANSVERIEVVTNPSAKYDPDGTSGIINIVLKTNKLRGFNGIASVTAATNNLYEGNLGFSYRNRKFNVHANYSLNYSEGYRNYNSDILRTFSLDSTERFLQDRIGTDLNSSNTLILGGEYFFNKRNTLGLSLTGSINRRERTGDVAYRLLDNSGHLSARWNRNSRDPRARTNAFANLNYTHKLKKDLGEIAMSFNHSIGTREVMGVYEEVYYDEFENESNLARLNQQLENNSSERVTTGQVDFNRVFEKARARMELGGKTILRDERLSTFSETKDTITGNFLEDTLANYQYKYSEQVSSAYGIFGQEVNNFKYQIGLRGEYAEQTPNLVSENTKIFNHYLNLFPSAHIKYELSEKSELSLSYSKRINRAKSRQMNPFKSFADPFNLRSGNPYLQPEYIHSFDLGYSYNGKKMNFSTSIFHRRTRDVINRVKEYYEDNSSLVTYGNIDESRSTGLEVVTIYKPFKWVKSTLTFNGNYIEYVNADENVDWNNSGINWGLKYILSIDFWKKTASAQLNLKYNAPRTTPQGIVQPRQGVDLSFEKRLFKKKLSVGAKVTDIFNTKGFVIDYGQMGVEQNSEYKWLTRRFYVTLTYRWGSSIKETRSSRSDSGSGME